MKPLTLEETRLKEEIVHRYFDLYNAYVQLSKLVGVDNK